MWLKVKKKILSGDLALTLRGGVRGLLAPLPAPVKAAEKTRRSSVGKGANRRGGFNGLVTVGQTGFAG